MTNSTHKVEIVPVVLEPHPNADSLSIVKVFSGYTVVVRTDDWRGIDKGAYLPPDSIVDTGRDEFSWLAQDGRASRRIKVARLRGVCSMGLLVSAPAGTSLGDDVAEALGVTHYDPPIKAETGGEAGPTPEGCYRPKYDVESLRRYGDIFYDGEPIVVTEKIHGANGRWTADVAGDGELQLWAGSRSEWKRQGTSVWWAALEKHPEVYQWLGDHPGYTLYGEVYGQVQDLKYQGGLNIAIFDILDPEGNWMNWDDAQALGRGLPWVPVIAFYSFAEDGDINSIAGFLELAEGPSVIEGASNIREGIVVKPLVERTHPKIGRVIFKAVGNGYLERKDT